ncbi:MAG: PEGA domain-containing protein [Kofleriaceae bacterium]
MKMLAVVLFATTVAAKPPGNFTKEFQAGVDAFRLGKLDEARAHLEKAKKLDPKLPGPWRFLAAVAQQAQDYGICVDDAHEALRLNPQSSEAEETKKLYEACRTSAGRASYRGQDLGDAAAVAVTSNVPNATVRINKLSYGGTPMAPRRIAAGTLEVEVAKAGFKTVRVTIEAVPGIVNDVSAELVQ